MKIVKMIFVLTLLTAFNNTYAANNSGEVNIRYFKINSTYLTIYADVDYVFIDDSACQSGTKIAEAVVIERARDDFRELYAAVMLGLASNRKLAFWLDGSCSEESQGGPYPITTSVYVFDE